MTSRLAGWRSRLAGLFVDREFFMRANGQVRFIKITAGAQRRVALAAGAVLIGWALVTLAMVLGSWGAARDKAALAAKQARVATAAERVAAYRASVGSVADDLKQRQDYLDRAFQEEFGAAPAQAGSRQASEAQTTARKIGMAVPEAGTLAEVEGRQLAFAAALTRAAEARAQASEAAIRRYGLNPALLARTVRAEGGPLDPVFTSTAADDPRFAALAAALDHYDRMRTLLAGIPSTNPAVVPALTSSFGYRRDPFTGATAFHAGLDFQGPFGSPILAAADGRVSFVGQENGYGNVVEITHPGGIVTRYAHLSGFAVHSGEQVKRGQDIARMGSTGRSTGTHLHFEVRVNGAPVNPGRFLAQHGG